LVTTSSTGLLTGVLVVKELLAVSGSLVVEETLTVLETAALGGKLAATWTTMVKVGEAPAARVALTKVTVPVPPTAGVVVVQPAGAVAATKVVPAGMPSVRLTPCASLGPLLFSVIV